MVDTRLRIQEDYSVPRVSVERHRGPLALFISSLLIVDRLSRKGFSYRKLPTEPLKLSVLKLDGSCFDIEVRKTATVAELKQAVEAVFNHGPQKGPCKISWSLSRSSSLEEEKNDEEDSDCDDIEKGNLQLYDQKDKYLIQHRRSRMAHLFGGWYLCTRLAAVRRRRSVGLACPSGIPSGFVGGFRKIIWLLRKKRRREI